jgi:hypothetical protein
MKAIRVIHSCQVSGGEVVLEGQVYTVPEQVSEADAALIVRIGRAEFIEPEPEAEAEAAQKKKSKGGE